MLHYPNKSHRKTIHIPKESEMLAEFMGIEFGDGGINNQWQVVITLNSIKDASYVFYIQSLYENLFRIPVSIRKRPGKNAVVIVASSTSLVEFLVTKGAIRGNKLASNFTIPDWITRKSEYKIAFVRRLIDTDGCLYIHRHQVSGKTYHNLGLCFCSFSPPLLRAVVFILQEFMPNSRISIVSNKAYVYSYKSVIEYLKIFGSSNPRITEKYSEWRGRLVA
jgi:intein-encoded DNA endonuclease-like protein